MMIKERLSPCATLLYHWIQSHEGSPSHFELNLENFQVWTTEFLEEAASVKDIDQALLRLMQLQLIRVEAQGIITVDPDAQPAIKVEALPKKLWKMWTWEQRVAVGSMAIASTILLIISGFVLFNFTQRHPETLTHPPVSLDGVSSSTI